MTNIDNPVIEPTLKNDPSYRVTFTVTYFCAYQFIIFYLHRPKKHDKGWQD